MNPVPPHHLLSAYLDGELSPAERERVERLLEESAEARQELRELEQIGQLLRQLPRESLPKTFALNLLDFCQSETAVSEGETHALAGTVSAKSRQENPLPRPSPHAGFLKRRFGWIGLAALGISAAAGLMLMLKRPDSPTENDNRIARQETANPAGDRSASPMFAESDEQVFPMSDRGSLPADVPGEASSDAMTPLNAEAAALSPQADASPAPAGNAEERRLIAQEGANFKNIAPGDMAEALDRRGDEVAVVKLIVGDRQQALKELETLLRRHQIVLPGESAFDQTPAGFRDVRKDSSLAAVYVEAGNDRLTAALRDLQSGSAIQGLSMEAPISLALLDSWSPPPSAELSGAGRQVQRFGGRGGLDSAARSFRSTKPDAAPQESKATGEEKPPKEKGPDEPFPIAPEPAKTSKDGQGAKPKTAGARDSREPSAADSVGRPQAQAGQSNEPKKEAESKMPAPSQAAGGRSRQLMVPADVLKSLQKKPAEERAGDPQAAKTEAYAAQSAGPARKRVQVLFILVDPSASSESPPVPAGQRN